MRFETKISGLLLLFLIIGIALGYIGAYISYRLEVERGDTYRGSYLEIVILPSIPGQVAAAWFSPHDWQFEEVWKYRHLIAICNGILYLLVACALAAPIVATRAMKQFDRTSEQTVDDG